MDKILHFNEEKDYKKLLQQYFDGNGQNCQVKSGYNKEWLKGYVACLYGSMIIDDIKRHELNCFIEKLREKEILIKGRKSKC